MRKYEIEKAELMENARATSTIYEDGNGHKRRQKNFGGRRRNGRRALSRLVLPDGIGYSKLVKLADKAAVEMTASGSPKMKSPTTSSL